jgi:riboflavin biosynthesis pyrimidine reductase
MSSPEIPVTAEASTTATALRRQPPLGEIWANIVIDSNGATVKSGSSRALSSPSDRAHFHRLREQVDALLIGGVTAAKEPYQLGQKLTYVLSRRPLPEKLANLENIRLIDLPSAAPLNEAGLGEICQRLRAQHRRILCEGGARLLTSLIAADQISELFITRSKEIGDIDSDRFNFQPGASWRLVASEQSGDGDEFLHFRKISIKGDY